MVNNDNSQFPTPNPDVAISHRRSEAKWQGLRREKPMITNGSAEDAESAEKTRPSIPVSVSSPCRAASFRTAPREASLRIEALSA